MGFPHRKPTTIMKRASCPPNSGPVTSCPATTGQPTTCLVTSGQPTACAGTPRRVEDGGYLAGG